MDKTRSERHHQRRQVPLWLGLAAAAIIMIGGGGVYAVINSQANTVKDQPQEAKQAESSKKDDKKTEVSTSETMAEVAEAATESKLVPGKNHNVRAEAYAHPTKDVQDVMAGRKIHEGSKVAFLTFDDGANNEITPQILDILKEQQVPATFFIVGNQIGEATAPMLKREIAEGHGLALHSFNHNYDVNPVVVREEAIATQKVIKEAVGEEFETKVWRYPGGHMSWPNIAPADGVLAELGLHWIDWNATNGDAEVGPRTVTTKEAMAAYHENTLTAYPDTGMQVVLMHDSIGKNVTVEALPMIIEFYRSRGYQFGILS